MDWKNIIKDLIDRGYTKVRLGREIGMTGANIYALTINADQEPGYEAGAKLIAIHKKVMRKYPKIDVAA